MSAHRYLSNFCGSTFWDSSYSWYTDYPQFTPCFEQTVLAWIPIGFLIVVSPFELRAMYRSKSANIPWNWKNISKMVFSFIAIAAVLADVVRIFLVVFAYGATYYAVELTTPSLRLLSVVFCTVLVQRQRQYGVRASGLMFIFWLFVAIMGISQLRREINKFLTGDSDFRSFSFTTYYASGVVLLLLNFLVDAEPLIHSLEEESDKPSPEKGSSFPSKVLLTWFGKLTSLGYKRPLMDDDLWDLHAENTSIILVPDFQRSFVRNKTKSKNNKTSIVPILVSTFAGTFLKGAFLEFVISLLIFVYPQLLKLLINFVTNGEDHWRGVLYATLLLLTATVQTLIASEYLNIESLISLRTTTMLTSAIYRKALTLSSTARKTSTIGEIVNLMSVDVHRVSYFAGYINMVWSAPLEIFLAVFFLWNILGWSVLVGFAFMTIMVPISVFTAKCNKNIQKKYMSLKDSRIKLMSDILAGIKVMKLYAWEPSYEKMVLKIREEEVKSLKQEAYFDALTTFVWTCAPYLVTLVSFTTYVLSGHTLNAETAFVSLSLFNILRFPFDQLPWMLTSAVQCKVAVTRINKYLNEADLDEESVERPSPVGTYVPDLGLVDASFAWDRNEPPTLKNISLNITSNSLVAIVGPVGSGKSSLISAFLGEMEKLSGRVHVLGSVAYAPQVPWVQNDTLKNNILFGKPFNEEFYSKVIKACALQPDLDMLPGGDLTEIGEKGINLSGGQKQRISFARAVYSNADIYFLDDPMSAVDSHVGKHLFEEVIGHGGLLSGKIRILVTHVLTFLPLVDSIIVLQDGQISEVGTYDELLKRKGDFSEYLNSYSQDSAASIAQAHKSSKKKGGVEKRDRQISVTSKSSRALRMDSWSVSSESSDDFNDNDDAEEGKLIEKEKAEIEGVKWSVYIHFFKSTGPCVLAAMLIFNFLAESIMICSNFWLSAWSTDSSLVVNGTVDVHKRDVYLGVYGALGLGLSATAIFAYLAPVLGTLYASIKMHERLLKSTMGAPMSFFDTVPSGRIVSRFSKDVDSLDSDLPHAISEFLFIFSEVIGILVVITVTTPIFIAGIIPIGIVYYFIQRYFLATSRQLKRLESISRSPIYSHFSETIAGAPVIRAYGFQPKFIEESEKKVDFNQKCCYYEIIANRWLGIRLESLGNFIIFFAALFVVFSRGSLSDGLTGLSLTYALEITGLLNWLVRSTAEVETSIVAVERIKQYEEISQESSSGILPGQGWPQVGKIEFRNLSLRYRDGLDLILKDLTFTINGGEKIGIVGRTGAGKSSLTLALFRIVEPAQGEILIDGVEITKLRLHYLRSGITIIPQDPILFSATMRVNLDPFEKYTDEEIWQALESSHLKTLVSSFPQQLNHVVAEGGANFSAGQRQLICLARALLRKTKILVLDEATAAVDLETDDLVQATIRSEFASCTILTIAHRINTVIDSDRVLVLDAGTVSEFDNPSVLLRDSQSLFYSLAKDAGLVS